MHSTQNENTREKKIKQNDKLTIKMYVNEWKNQRILIHRELSIIEMHWLKAMHLAGLNVWIMLSNELKQQQTTWIRQR